MFHDLQRVTGAVRGAAAGAVTGVERHARPRQGGSCGITSYHTICVQSLEYSPEGRESQPAMPRSDTRQR
jgi:hypothetical protein